MTVGLDAFGGNPRQRLRRMHACIRAIYLEDPDYVPRMNEEAVVGFQFEGNFKTEDWTDK